MKIHTSIVGALAPKKVFVAGALVLSLTVGGIATNIIKNTFALEGDDDGDTPAITTDDPGIKRYDDSSLRDELPERIYLLTNISPKISIAGSTINLAQMIPIVSELAGGQDTINFDDYNLDSLDIVDDTIVRLDDKDGRYYYGKPVGINPGQTTIIAERDGERVYIPVTVGKMYNSPIKIGHTGKDLEFEVKVEGFSSSLLRFETQGVMSADENPNATITKNGNKFTLKTPATTGNKFMNNLYLAPIAVVVDDTLVGAVMAIAVPFDLINVTDNISISPENQAKLRGIFETVTNDIIGFVDLLAASSNVEQDFFDTILDKFYDLRLKPLFENGELIGLKDFDLTLKDGTILHISSTQIIQQIKEIAEEESHNRRKKATKLNVDRGQIDNDYYEDEDDDDNTITQIISALSFNLDATDGTDDSLASALPKGTKGIKTKNVDSGLNLTAEGHTVRIASVTRLNEPLEYTFDASDAEPETNLKRRWFVAYYDNGEKKVTEATYDASTQTIKFSANATGTFTYGYIDGYTAPLVPNTGSISSNAAKTAIATFIPVVALAIAAFAVRTKKKQSKKLAKNLKNWN